MKELLRQHIAGKKVAILGFGREGRSTYRLIKKYFPDQDICIADKNPALNITEPENDHFTSFQLGADYLDQISTFDVIFKSPGVSIQGFDNLTAEKKILTQTSLFIQNYSSQIIGITGTKGKSTTSSLIHHIFETAGRKSVFVGNIGVPAFDAIDAIEEDTSIIFELSAHQLEQTVNSPHIAILLNIFSEHLDYFQSFDKYAKAKSGIAKFQDEADFFICGPESLKFPEKEANSFKGTRIYFSDTTEKADVFLKNEQIHSPLTDGENIDISKRKLPGQHNLKNLLAATSACLLSNISTKFIEQGISTFQPLEHRLEYAGTFCGIRFINDSISTIPESTIEALKTINDVDTLILGGFDRGIDYSKLIAHLAKYPVKNIFLTGTAGTRIHQMLKKLPLKNQKTICFKKYAELQELISTNTQSGKTCLLSPAASSYDQFNNFMERGLAFKKIAELLGKSCR
jgi:UDP-N-acetylmuramoylalanine--D-glutamate ligase